MPISFGEKTKIVVTSVVISLAAMAVYKLVKPMSGLGSGDDAPIIMAGGSFYLGTHEDLQFKTQGDTLVLWNLAHGIFGTAPAQVTNRYVASVDVIDYQDNLTSYPPPGGTTPQDMTLAVTYCDTVSCGKQDVITMQYTISNGAFIFSDVDSSNKHPIAKSHKLLTNLAMHPRKGWQITKITSTWITGTAPSCGQNGECSIVVHTCQTGANCI